MPVELLVGLSLDVSDALFERYCRLAGELGDGRVLALVETRAQQQWACRLRLSGRARAEDRVFTPGAWIRRELDVWWPLVEAGLEADGWSRTAGTPAEPLLVQADAAQELMAACAEPYVLGSGAFVGARTPPSLRHVHLTDTLARAAEQELDLDEACRRLISGAATPDAAAHRQHVLPCLQAYRDTALRHRVLDAGLAWWVFGRYVLPARQFQEYLGAGIGALLVEGLEAASPLLQRVVRTAAAGAAHVALGWRVDGAGVPSVGLDGAGVPDWPGALLVETPAGGPSAALAGARVAGILRWDGAPSQPNGGSDLGLRNCGMHLFESGTYPEMLDRVVADAAAARRAGLQVAIVLPRVTQLQLWWLRQGLQRLDLPIIVSAGTNRLVDYRPVRVALALACLAVPDAAWEPLDRDVWTDILEEITGADAYVVAGLADELAADPSAVLAWASRGPGHDAEWDSEWDSEPDGDDDERAATSDERAATSGGSGSADGGDWADVGPLLAGIPRQAAPAGGTPLATDALNRLRGWAAQVRNTKISLAGIFRLAFARVLAPRKGDLDGPAGHVAWERADQINQLVSAAERFQALDERLGGRWGTREAAPGLGGLVSRFCQFLLAGGFAERPMAIRPEPDDAILVTTASQMAQRGNPVDVQIWLDVSSPAWFKSDDRELTNSRVLLARRDPGPYDPAESQADSSEKLARTILACCTLARQEVRCYSALLDAEARDQPGGLADALVEYRRSPGSGQCSK